MPTKPEILAAIQMQIDTLRDSFTDRIGPTKGRITNHGIVLEIRCLEAAKKIVNRAQRGA